MRSEIFRKSLLFFILFLAFGGVALSVNYLLVNNGIEMSYRINFMFFFLHFLALGGIIFISHIKKEFIVYKYFVFLVVKMGSVIYMIYRFPIIKNNLILYFCFYWYYLIIETILVIALIKVQDENHKINKQDTF